MLVFATDNDWRIKIIKIFEPFNGFRERHVSGQASQVGLTVSLIAQLLKQMFTSVKALAGTYQKKIRRVNTENFAEHKSFRMPLGHVEPAIMLTRQLASIKHLI